MDQLVKESPAVQETRVQSLDREGMAPAPVFLPGKFPGQRSLVGCSAWSHERVGHGLATEPPPTLEMQRHVSLFCYVVSNQVWEVLEGEGCIWSGLYSVISLMCF